MRPLLGVITVVALACGGGDSGGPSTASVDGTWNATWTNMNGGGSSCAVNGAQLNLTQSNTTFTGTYNFQHLICDETDFGAGGGNVVNGTISGNDVTFDLNTQALHQTGTVSGNSMSGTAIWTTTVGGVTVTLNGTWSASH